MGLWVAPVLRAGRWWPRRDRGRERVDCLDKSGDLTAKELHNHPQPCSCYRPGLQGQGPPQVLAGAGTTLCLRLLAGSGGHVPLLGNGLVAPRGTTFPTGRVEQKRFMGLQGIFWSPSPLQWTSQCQGRAFSSILLCYFQVTQSRAIHLTPTVITAN